MQDWRKMDIDGEVDREWRWQAGGRKRDRPGREEVARGSGNLRDKGHRAPLEAARVSGRYSGVASGACAPEVAVGSGGNAVHGEQWERGGGQCKRHWGEDGQANALIPGRQEGKRKRRGKKRAAVKTTGGGKRGGMGKDETRTPRAKWETSPANQTGQQTWSGAWAWSATHEATSALRGKGYPTRSAEMGQGEAGVVIEEEADFTDPNDVESQEEEVDPL